MNLALQQVLAQTFDYLSSLVQENIQPGEAKARLRRLAAEHPETQMNLAWVQEAASECVHYDLLIRPAVGATVCLSLCPDDALPWPLRGSQRWSEKELARVNGVVLRIERAVACLDFIWNEAPLVQRLINVCLIEEELARQPIEINEAELQAGMDAFRRSRGLLRADDTQRWLEQSGLDQTTLERVVVDHLIVARLRERVTAGQVARYFEEHGSDFDSVCIAEIEFTTEDDARRTLQAICQGEASFYEVAQRQFLAAAGKPKSKRVAQFVSLRRYESPAELAAALFGAAPGDVVGPVQVGGRSLIAQVLSITRAQLEEDTAAAIQARLFERWLEERRRTATIQWNWGNAAQTAAVARAAGNTPMLSPLATI